LSPFFYVFPILSLILPSVKAAYQILPVHRIFQQHSIGGENMQTTLEKRACELAVYMIETGATVRSAAKQFGISKSTVHKTLTQRLRQCNYPLYLQVREILDKNKRERHIRGGMATKRKYQKM
jgi:putative DeoR family transcriptional regulator (stage III sporulation protein D)